eukprot:101383-Rhodomonas_salina.1
MGSIPCSHRAQQPFTSHKHDSVLASFFVKGEIACQTARLGFTFHMCWTARDPKFHGSPSNASLLTGPLLSLDKLVRLIKREKERGSGTQMPSLHVQCCSRSAYLSASCGLA